MPSEAPGSPPREVDQQLATTSDLQILDVRGPGERQAGTIPGALIIPLTELRTRTVELDLDRPVVAHCAGGYRSSIAVSWLRSQGAKDVSDLLGGYSAWTDRAEVAQPLPLQPTTEHP